MFRHSVFNLKGQTKRKRFRSYLFTEVCKRLTWHLSKTWRNLYEYFGCCNKCYLTGIKSSQPHTRLLKLSVTQHSPCCNACKIFSLSQGLRNHQLIKKHHDYCGFCIILQEIVSHLPSMPKSYWLSDKISLYAFIELYGYMHNKWCRPACDYTV